MLKNIKFWDSNFSTVTQKQFKYPLFENIIGYEEAKLAITLTIAHKLKLLIIGHPGIGKSMLAKSASNLNENIIEILPIAPKSTFIKTDLNDNLFSKNPGATIIINEFSELKKDCIESIRHLLDMPNKCSLIATMNPCRCGYFGHLTIPCKCSPQTLKSFQAKIPPAIYDRFDVILVFETEPTISSELDIGSLPQTLPAISYIEASQNLEIIESFADYEKYFLDSALMRFKELVVKYSIAPRRAVKILNLANILAKQNKNSVLITVDNLIRSFNFQKHAIPRAKNDLQP